MLYPEKPDFIAKLNGKTIGIELTDLILLEKEKEKEGILSKAFQQIIYELQSEKKDYNGLYRIEDTMDFIELNLLITILA